jgi:CDP-diacylglycerol--glycerol-3-phosphate 3-phosphatidyltransferase
VEARFTVPNVLTVVRIAMAAAAAMLAIDGRLPGVALALLVTGALLDVFDGWYARAFAQSSHLGKHLDPFADKILVAVMYAWIGSDARSPWVWGGIGLVLARELAVTALRAWSLRRHGRYIPANSLGRLKMFLQCASGLTILGVTHWLGRTVPVPVVIAALGLAVLVATLSAASYLRAWRACAAGPVPATRDPAVGEQGKRMAGVR